MSRLQKCKEPRREGFNFFVVGVWLFIAVFVIPLSSYYIGSFFKIENEDENHTEMDIETFEHESHNYIRFKFRSDDSTVILDPNCEFCLTKEK